MVSRRLLLWRLVGCLLIAFAIFVVPATGMTKSAKHIRFPVGGWSGDFLPPYIVQVVLGDELGYTVEVLQISDVASAVALSRGEIELNFFLWFPNSEPAVKPFFENGSVVDLGVLYGDLPQGFFVSKREAQQYGIRSIPDLNNPELVKLFDDDGDGKGDLLGCPAEWACARLNDETLDLYGLDKLYEQKMGSARLLTAAIIGKMEKNEPVLMSNFWPNDIFIHYPRGEAFVYLEDPKKFWGFAHVPKLANAKWVAENPKAVELLRAMKISGEDIMWMMGQVEEKGDDPATLEALAREWVSKNKALVDSWLEAIE